MVLVVGDERLYSQMSNELRQQQGARLWQGLAGVYALAVHAERAVRRGGAWRACGLLGRVPLKQQGLPVALPLTMLLRSPFTCAEGVSCVKLARSGGVVTRSRDLRQQARKLRVEEYFYGCLKVRCVL